MKQKTFKAEFAMDRKLNIHTCGIEEWDSSVLHYHRSEPTPYRALARFLEVYSPPEEPYLIDFGAGRGRVNFYFHHKLGAKGYGIELHPERFREAVQNQRNYAHRWKKGFDALGVDFITCPAEDHLPIPQSNMFFFFHPFSDHIFEQCLENIARSISQHDRTADLILYYPSFGYFRAVAQHPMFEAFQFVDMDWNEDERDGFWVFRHVRESDCVHLLPQAL